MEDEFQRFNKPKKGMQESRRACVSFGAYEWFPLMSYSPNCREREENRLPLQIARWRKKSPIYKDTEGVFIQESGARA